MPSTAAREGETERQRRERERREFKEAQELESLRRAFKRIDKKGDGSIDVEELLQELHFLDYKVKQSEVALTIWEVDDDADGAIDWDEFRTMYYRIQSDQTGYEPRKLFNVVEFLMHDKNFSGSIDVDECVTILYQRLGKEVVDEAMKEEMKDCEDVKSVSFSKYVSIEAKASKLTREAEVKQGATKIPQVKPVTMVAKDPALWHLQ